MIIYWFLTSVNYSPCIEFERHLLSIERAVSRIEQFNTRIGYV